MEHRAKFVHTAAQPKQKQTQTIINYCGCGCLNLYVESVSVYWERRAKYEALHKNPEAIHSRVLELSENISAKIMAKGEWAKKKSKTTTATNELSLAFIVFNCLAGVFFHVDMYLGGCAICTLRLQLIYPLSVLHSIAVSVFKSILIRSLLSLPPLLSLCAISAFIRVVKVFPRRSTQSKTKRDEEEKKHLHDYELEKVINKSPFISVVKFIRPFQFH